MLAVIESHPVQYHAPVYRSLREKLGIPLTAIYGSDFSVSGYSDTEFGAAFSWDTDLLSGYASIFLSRVADGGARVFEEVSARGMRAALQKLSPDVALIVGYATHFNRRAFYEAWRRGCPILFRGETTDHSRQRSFVRSVLRDVMLRSLYRRTARLLYIGERSYQHYRRLEIPEKQLIFSPYCVDEAGFQCDEATRAALRFTTRQRMGIQENDIVILFSGKLSPRKGPDLLLEAIKILPQDLRNGVMLLFLGSGELSDKLEKQAQTPPALNAVFLGFQNQSQLSQYYHAADLLVLPSLHSETWGLVVNEALRHGLPCVVSQAVGCTPDLIAVGDTGEVFETGSIDSLAAAVTRALMLIGRPEIREKCRRQVAGYTVEKAAEGIARAYQEAVSQSIPPGVSHGPG